MVAESLDGIAAAGIVISPEAVVYTEEAIARHRWIQQFSLE